MEFIAKEITLNNSAYNGKHLALCIFSKDPELLEMIVSIYPIVTKSHSEPLYTEFKGNMYKVVAFISKEARAYDGEILIEADLYWCDPAQPEFFPLDKYLYSEKPSWITNEIKIKRKVFRIV